MKNITTYIATALLVTGNAMAGGLNFPDWTKITHGEEPLPVEQAFTLNSRIVQPGIIELSWRIEDGYYMYKNKTKIEVQQPNSIATQPQWPQTETIEDIQFGKVEIYRQQVALQLQLQEENNENNTTNIQVRYQGCKENSVCYPPVNKTISFTNPWNVHAATQNTTQTTETAKKTDTTNKNILWLVISIAFITGLGLALTPCVFPLIPLVSGYLVGTAGQSSTARAVALTATYVVSMATVYGAIGIIAATANFNVQAASQAPAFVIAFSIFLLLMGLSMLGMFQLQLPMFIRQWLDSTGRKQQTGSIGSAATLGLISAFMVGPCTAPPLLAALAFANISQQPILAGSGMFFMGLGLGVPLLILGLSAGKILPKAGAWMQTIKQALGIGLIALALWAVQRLLPDHTMMLLWAALIITVAVAMGALEPIKKEGIMPKISKGIGILLIIHAATIIIGSAQGNRNIIQPLKNTTNTTENKQTEHLKFTTAENIQQLRQQLQTAQPVMLDYRADWCTVCLQLENETFTDKKVITALNKVKLIQVDVTDYNDTTRQLLQEFELYGPPAILFFKDNKEIRQARVYEFMDADTFTTHIQNTITL